MKGNSRRFNGKRLLNNILIVLFILIFVISYKVDEFSNSKSVNEVNTGTIIEDINVDVGKIKEYKVDLSRFNINSNGQNPIETSEAINAMLKEAYDNGYNKIVMPKGLYSISEYNPIVMVSNMILDLNGSTFKINPNGLQYYVVINFTKCKNSIITNGIIQGDRNEHDYETTSGSHEWTTGIVFNDSESCQLEKVIIKDFPGYGISSSLGENLSDLQIGVTTGNLIIGNITNKGKLNNKKKTIRTIEPLDISNVGKQFELGYNKGYMGYPYIQSKEYNSYFYDENMNYIEMKECKQYKKVYIPDKAKYVHFVFFQEEVPIIGDTDFANTTVFLTNYSSPYKIKISNCTIEGNRALGMALCGGRNFIIENNIFKENGGGAPGFAINLEDGWEYMDGYLFKNNKFIDNNNDVVVCAGDNISFEGNDFTSTVHMWGRATNYSFINNSFTDIDRVINYEYSSDTICTENTYTNCRLAIYSNNDSANLNISNERLIDASVNITSEEVIIKDSEILSENNSIALYGKYENCKISCDSGGFNNIEVNNCDILNTNVNITGEITIKNSNIDNLSLTTTKGDNKVNIFNNNIKDTHILVTTWGDTVEIDIENNEIILNKKAFLGISAGKLKNLVFKNNNVINISESSVFNMYDTGYTEPDGKATIIDNSFLQKYNYIFDGIDIYSGKFKLKNKNNIYKDIKFLNPKYEDNKYFEIIN